MRDRKYIQILIHAVFFQSLLSKAMQALIFKDNLGTTLKQFEENALI